MNRKLKQALARATDPSQGVLIEAVEHLVHDDPATSWDIFEAADNLAIGVYTLRDYEEHGLLAVPQDAQGQRYYDATTIRRLAFIHHLHTAGISIANLQVYVALVDAGPETIPQRLNLMLEYRDTLRRQIAQLQAALVTAEYEIMTCQEDSTV
ncbi:MAG: MerR family transcriptional regulator [Actinomycetaceae bacterium]|nr:MerR family transcriptional regulator [Actinomycetaceae bacterium]